ncbi:MAG TPA: hypothetical protein VGQ39_15920 [Pyrinomonadaceae bacterium]|jgi:hypothetical protein|nr:hypothetical protein [Pyrinomonadaceae bacterium]
MKIQRVVGAMAAVLLATLFIITASSSVCAQSTAQQTDVKEDETNLDTQLYLIVATNQPVTDDKLPASLDNVVKQLRSALPFKNYRLAATLINRVKNEGRLDLSWIGGPLAATAGPASPATPSFSQFKVRSVKLARNSAGDSVVQMVGFNFGARIPIQTGPVAATGGFPTTNYESTGLGTDISIREGEPVIVGTLNVGPSGDAIILVVSARRTTR